MADNGKTTNAYRFWVIGILLFGCVGLEYHFHIAHGITVVYTHLFYIPIIVAAFWWGLKAGLPVSLFFGLVHIALSFPDIGGSVLFRSLALVSVGSVIGIISDMRKRAEEALRDSEEKYRIVFENTGTATVNLEEDATISMANAGFEELSGYPREEIEGEKKWTEFVAKEDLERMKTYHAKRRKEERGEVPTEYEFRFVDRQSNIKHIFLKIGMIPGTKKSIASLMDITKRKRAEEKIKHLNLVLLAIRNVNQLVVTERNRDRLIQGACDNLTKNRGYYNAWIVLLDEAGKYVMSAEAGLGKDFFSMVERFKRGDLTPCGEKALSQAGVVVTGDTASACADCPLSNMHGGRNSMAIRLEYMEKIYGFMSVSIPEDFARSEEEQGLFEEVAGDIAFALYGMDIEAKRRRADQMLKESEEKYRVLFEGSTDAIYITTQDGKFVDFNKSMLDLLGYAREEMMGMKAQDIYAHPRDRNRFQKEMEKKGFVRDYELDLCKKDGAEIDCLITATVRRANDGGILGYYGIIRDITERKRAQEEKMQLEIQLRQAQKMEAIGTLAGGIAHDFNNILAAVIGYAELADLDVPEDSKTKHSLKELLKAGYRARDLVGQILAFSRQSVQERKPVYVSLVIKEALKLLRASLPTTIDIRQDIEIPPGQDTVLADPTQIHQVLMNLCTNAGHAMWENGGVLDVSLQNVNCGLRIAELETDEDKSAIRIPKSEIDLSPGKYIRLTVSDTGYGMTPEVMERMFDPYFTTKEKEMGTGMGLAVVHGIVESHGGAITVQSEPGKGSVFHVYLPTIERDERQEADATEESLPVGHERILFIDDEHSLVEIGKESLERLGYKVVTRMSSIEALELFRTKPDQFDLVITDMTMPNMTGDKLAEELMNIRPDIPVILCTGYSEHISKEKAEEMGISAFVMKPVVMKDLANTVRRILDE